MVSNAPAPSYSITVKLKSVSMSESTKSAQERGACLHAEIEQSLLAKGYVLMEEVPTPPYYAYVKLPELFDIFQLSIENKVSQ